MKIKCPECGKKIPEDSIFCPECGAQIRTPTYEKILSSQVWTPIFLEKDIPPFGKSLGKCVWCNNEIINPRIETIRVQSKYGMQNFYFKAVICPHCSHTYFFFVPKKKN